MNKKTIFGCVVLSLSFSLCGMFRFQRPAGPIPSSMLGLEVYTGAIDDFGFEDYLNGNCSLLLLHFVFLNATFISLDQLTPV